MLAQPSARKTKYNRRNADWPVHVRMHLTKQLDATIKDAYRKLPDGYFDNFEEFHGTVYIMGLIVLFRMMEFNVFDQDLTRCEALIRSMTSLEKYYRYSTLANNALEKFERILPQRYTEDVEPVMKDVMEEILEALDEVNMRPEEIEMS